MSKDDYKRTRSYYRMKADQHWDMAGLARKDGDQKDSERHTKLAREFESLAGDAARNEANKEMK